MSISNRFRIFLALALVVFLANLLVINDLATFWDGAESAMLVQALWSEGPSWLFPDLLLRALGNGNEVNAFLLRLPAAVGLILSLAGFYWLGRLVYGKETTLFTILVMGASFLIPFTGKLAAGDAWLLGAHLLAYQSLILYLKQPVARWRWSFYGFLLLGAWIHPLSTLVFLPGVATILYFLHPQGKRLFSLNPWLAALAIGLIFFLAGWLAPERPGFLLGFGNMPFGRFALVLVLGLLPFSGFWIAGTWDAFQKFRQGEELSQLTFAWLITAVIAQSPAAEAALAFLAAKQMLLFFDPRYPHRGIVRAVSVLHLVLVFFGIIFLLIRGFQEFQGIGFRAGMAVGAVYWMLSLASVIGMFGMTRRLVIGATVMSGMAAFLFFWLQLYPLWEVRRDLPGRLVESVRKRQAEAVWLAWPPDTPPDNVWIYLRAAFPGLKILPGQDELRRAWEAGQPGIYLVPEAMATGLETEAPADTISGWNDRLEEERYLRWNR